MKGKRRTRLLSSAVGAGCLLVAVASSFAVTESRPESFCIGAHVISLGDFDPGKGTFSSTFWLWSTLPKGKENLIKELDFTNAKKRELLNTVTIPEKGMVLFQQKVSGVFAHHWDLTNFPFDRHTLSVALEADGDTGEVILVPDHANSSVAADLEIEGWKITGFRVMSKDHRYNSNFGDPKLPPGSPSTYSSIFIETDISRSSHVLFWKLTVAAFAAVFLAFITYFLRSKNDRNMGPKFSILAGSLFAIVISMKSASAELGSSGTVNLIDKIHMLALCYVVLAAISAVTGRFFLDHGIPSSQVDKGSFVAALVSTCLLGIALFVVIRSAILAG